MAFPTIAATTTSTQTSPVTSHPITIPIGGSPFAVYMAVLWTQGNISLEGWPEPWQVRAGFVGNDVFRVYTASIGVDHLPRLHVGGAAAAVADFTATTVHARRSVVRVYRFAEEFPVENFVSSGETGGGATPADPPNLVYSGSAQDVLWFAIASSLGPVFTTPPASYPLYNFFTSPGANIAPALAARELNAASENPGAFAPTPGSDWHAVTIGVSLDGP